MRDAKKLRTIAGLALALAGLAAAYQAGRARAGGVPGTDPLVYTGFLEENGQPVTGPRDLGVAIVDGGGAALPGCDAGAPDTPVTAGRFSIVLGAGCVDSIKKQGPDLFLQVRLDDKDLGDPVRIAAVPFAVEASRADGLTDKARLELTYPDCPIGYTREAGEYTVCKKAADPGAKDEVVRVGKGGNAFWIDRYEASVTQNPDGTGQLYFDAANPPPNLPTSGYVQVDVAYARSVPGAKPARSITWLQAETVCRASGKRLPTRQEWLAAVQGTSDPGGSDGSGGKCNTMSAGPRETGNGGSCSSRWGVQDMIGNLQEWVAEWHTRPHDQLDSSAVTAWDFGDVSMGIENESSLGGSNQKGLPRAEQRGGSWNSGVGAGAFMIANLNGPYTAVSSVGFRCVIGR